VYHWCENLVKIGPQHSEMVDFKGVGSLKKRKKKQQQNRPSRRAGGRQADEGLTTTRQNQICEAVCTCIRWTKVANVTQKKYPSAVTGEKKTCSKTKALLYRVTSSDRYLGRPNSLRRRAEYMHAARIITLLICGGHWTVTVWFVTSIGDTTPLNEYTCVFIVPPCTMLLLVPRHTCPLRAVQHIWCVH